MTSSKVLYTELIILVSEDSYIKSWLKWIDEYWYERWFDTHLVSIQCHDRSHKVKFFMHGGAR